MFGYGDIGIRKITEKDLEFMLRVRSDQRISEMVGSYFDNNMEDQKKWFSDLQSRKDKSYFILYIKNTEEAIGYLRFDEIDYFNRSIRVGGDISPDFQNKGYGRKMFELIKKYCFDYLNMNRIWLSVLDFNSIARKLYLNTGMKEEGRQRKAIFKNGKYHDYIIMSMLREEYGESKSD